MRHEARGASQIRLRPSSLQPQASSLEIARVQNPDQNEALALTEKAFAQAGSTFKVQSSKLEDAIRSAHSYGDIENRLADMRMEITAAIEAPLAIAIFNIHLLGRAQIYADAVGGSKVQSSNVQGRNPKTLNLEPGTLNAIVLDTSFEPLPFDEAIDYFRSKTDVTAFQFRQLTSLAQQKAFTIGGAATRQVRLSIREIIEEALTEGVTLGEFQKRANEVMDRAGLSQRTPWYWETVYRTNLQTSYQVGRWKQMTTPAIRAARPFLRYVSALLPTTRASHREKHGRVYPTDHPFWTEWYPPNGFNCYCTVTSVSESLLARRGWKVSEDMDFAFPDPDDGFQVNAGRADEI